MSASLTMQKPQRPWLLMLALLLAALLHAATWLGLGMGAFVFWNSIHTFYFQYSYAAGFLPLVMASLLLATVLFLLVRKPFWAGVPAFVAMIASFVMLPRMGTISPLHPFLHPMQAVHWAAMALTWGACLWLFLSARVSRTGA